MNLQHKMQNLDVDQHKDSNSNGSYEDAEDWNTSTSIDLYEIANAAGQLADNLGAHPEALDEFFNKLKLLEHEWYATERRYQNLQIENDKLCTQLENERARSTMFHKKFKFLQDNHKNLERLKQVYMNMQYQESTDRPFVEIKEKCSQTTGLVALDISPKVSSNSVTVKRSELTEAQKNLQELKEMVRKREKSWALNVKRESTLREHINILQNEKTMLNQLLKAKEMELKATKLTEEDKLKLNDGFDELKRLIVKMDKRFRELEKIGKIGKYTIIFSEKERKLLQELSDKDASLTRQLKKIRPRGVSPGRSGMNRSASAPVSKATRANQPPMKGTQSHDKGKRVLSTLKEPPNEMQELEVLAKIKKEIGRKQANLKLLETKNFAGTPAACPLSTAKR